MPVGRTPPQIVVATGVAIGAAMGGWMALMGLTGLYKRPALLGLFWVVVLLEVGVLALGLRRSARAGLGLLGQLAAGTLMSLLGAAVVFGASLLVTQVLVPTYFEELRALQGEILRQRGLDAAAIRSAIDEASRSQTPLRSAIAGALGTAVTGTVAPPRCEVGRSDQSPSGSSDRGPRGLRRPAGPASPPPPRMLTPGGGGWGTPRPSNDL